jgi:5-methylcytosine-specific restriction protein B
MRGNMSPQPTSRIWLFKAESLEEENLFIAGGFYGFGASEDAVDADKFETEKSLKDALKKRWGGLNLPNQRADSYFWWFAKEAKPGDDVYLCRTSSKSNLIAARGRITGSYVFHDTTRTNGKIAGKSKGDYAHSISVDWISRPLRKTDIAEETGYVHSDIVRKLNEFQKYNVNPHRLQEILDNFMPKHPLNLISYGPPGTGKTYHAITRAVAICNNVSAELQIKRIDNRKQVELDYQRLNKEGRIEMITFHQSYDYTDFISGIRPSLNDKRGLSYELTKGPLYRIASRASAELKQSFGEKREPNAFVLIVDEINRGNVAKIFGELITLIDEDKRWSPSTSSGIGIPLLYEEKGAPTFCLPSNLYIIGTMNSSDRSVQKLDSALRRRFFFDAVDPSPDLIKTEKSMLADFLAQLNVKLEEKRPNSGCQVGHAWFMKKGQVITENADIVEILNEKVFPLLQEWFWDDDRTIRSFFVNDSSSYLVKAGRLTYDKTKTEEIESFFAEFTKPVPKK